MGRQCSLYNTVQSWVQKNAKSELLCLYLQDTIGVCLCCVNTIPRLRGLPSIPAYPQFGWFYGHVEIRSCDTEIVGCTCAEPHLRYWRLYFIAQKTVHHHDNIWGLYLEVCWAGRDRTWENCSLFIVKPHPNWAIYYCNGTTPHPTATISGINYRFCIQCKHRQITPTICGCLSVSLFIFLAFICFLCRL